MRLQQLADRSGVHKATLHHWLSGKVRRPYFWDRLLLVAIALDLDKPATDKLLHAAGLIPIDRLRAANQPERVRKLLDRWPA
jgi:transcriptional regulator with XRE-family HTH domain